MTSPSYRVLCICANCASTFEIYKSRQEEKATRGQYCSRRCYLDGRPKETTERAAARFWKNISNGPSCWLWGAHDNAAGIGYGRISFRGERWLAHRFAYWLTAGRLSRSLDVLHRCDDTRCCNPAHLYVGTHADNMRDKAERGRSARLFGELSGTHKLTEADIFYIRESSLNRKELACIYTVSKTTIGDIINRKTWGHI